jgi:hypothetical protein
MMISSPERGGGPRREAPWWWGRKAPVDPSTALRAIPLPVPGRRG